MAKTRVIDNRIAKVLVTEAQINESAKMVAGWISKTYKGKKVVLVGLLKGSIPFFAKVLPLVTIPCRIDFVGAESFMGGTKASKIPVMTAGLKDPVRDWHVVIIEDIVDSGRTLAMVAKNLKVQGALTVEIVALLDKPAGRKIKLTTAISCHVIPNLFVVGFGLDYKELFRNLPYIGVMEEKMYNSQDLK